MSTSYAMLKVQYCNQTRVIKMLIDDVLNG